MGVREIRGRRGGRGGWGRRCGSSLCERIGDMLDFG